jgi:hypothetical protein
MILEPVLKPIVLSLEPDQDARRPTVTGDQNFPICSQLEVAREVILYLCQGDPASLD